MAKFVPSASGQLRDMEKLTFFLNCPILLSFMNIIHLFLAVCSLYCWESMQIIMIHQKPHVFFQNQFWQKMRRRHRDVGIGTFCLNIFFAYYRNQNLYKVFVNLCKLLFTLTVDHNNKIEDFIVLSKHY